ncbi:unnamed protein product [Cladocopium goreaui]|uniref:Uncharacterized protein n=1 Tax=Cladocopium goreaui TaxID=2562237 RepID=A0A9P1GES6_9DINO|nr:unnamed protein product [Cladocopium goreaui]
MELELELEEMELLLLKKRKVEATMKAVRIEAYHPKPAPPAVCPDNLDTLPMEFLPEVPGFSGEDPASPKLKEAVWIDSSPTESFPTPEPDSCSRYWAKVAEEEQKRDDRLAQERLAALNLCLTEVDEKNGFTLPAGTGTNMCDDVESDGVSATVHDDSDDEGHEFDEQKVDHPQECAGDCAELQIHAKAKAKAKAAASSTPPTDEPSTPATDEPGTPATGEPSSSSRPEPKAKAKAKAKAMNRRTLTPEQKQLKSRKASVYHNTKRAQLKMGVSEEQAIAKAREVSWYACMMTKNAASTHTCMRTLICISMFNELEL